MSTLKEILDNKRREIALAKQTLPLTRLKDMPGFARQCLSLQKALYNEDVAVIAEIKKASPSKNVIREDFDPLKIAREYVRNGASAISVLTDKKYFQGDIRFIHNIRPFVPIPILRKDFIIDSYQLIEAKAFGADAVLLIVAALEQEQLHDLYTEATKLGLDCLVEVHKEQELESLDLSRVKMIGINNRDLTDFTVDVSTTLRLTSYIPSGITIVSESGISSRVDIEHLRTYGIHAVLVGESLMRAADPGEALRSLLTQLGDDI